MVSLIKEWGSDKTNATFLHSFALTTILNYEVLHIYGLYLYGLKCEIFWASNGNLNLVDVSLHLSLLHFAKNVLTRGTLFLLLSKIKDPL